MLAPGPMAALAGDPEDKPGRLEAVIGRSIVLEGAGMALKAARHDRPVELGRAVGVTRAVDPGIDAGPVRHRELEELVLVPVQVRLSLPPRTDDDVEALRAAQLLG